MTRNELYTILQRCGSETSHIHTLDKIWGRSFDGETEKITERDTERDTKRDSETAEEKLAWLKILLVTKSCDPVFTDYWLRLARRNLRLGLPLTTPEPELNPATEESSATLSIGNEADFVTKSLSRESAMTPISRAFSMSAKALRRVISRSRYQTALDKSLIASPLLSARQMYFKALPRQKFRCSVIWIHSTPLL